MKKLTLRLPVIPMLVIYSLLCIWVGSCRKCSAQQIIGRPMLPLSSSYFPSDAGIRFRWVASDLNSSPVSSWTDRITGSVMTQSTSGNKPTWDATGVKFDGVDDFLTLTNFVAGDAADNWGVLVVMKLNVTTANQIILGNLSAGQIYLGLASADYFYESVGGSTSIGPLPTTPFDFLACTTTNASNKYRCYTNGLTAFQSGTIDWNNGVAWPRLGRGNGNGPFNGTIKEIIVWTNYTFTVSQISRIHQYTIDTYGITP